MTVLTENGDSRSRSTVQEFYKGRTVFVTGGTGFLGKILIEKLLRACTDIGRIYILVRSKNGVNAEERLEKMFEDPAFDRLKRKMPMYREKIHTLIGDCSLTRLGLSESASAILQEETSIVFHLAATVRFNEKIKRAVITNVKGTKELLELCTRMKKLKALVYVSTAFSNCIYREVDEKFYEPPIKGDTILDLVEHLKEEDLDFMERKLVGNFPNTYSYTKCITEDVVRQYETNLPIGIFRPAIDGEYIDGIHYMYINKSHLSVISSYKEPIEGWAFHVYGPNGICIGTAAGLIRVIRMNLENTAQLVPVDLTVNALIAVAWDVARKRQEKTDIPIYNYHSSWNNSLTWRTYMELALKHGKKIPSTKSIWCYSVTTTSNAYYYTFLSILFHILPGLIIDFLLITSGKKPKLTQTYKKIHKHMALITYFVMNDWKFSNANMQNLWQSLTNEDREFFYFSMKDFDWDDYMQRYVRGLRLYIFQEDPSTIPIAKKRMTKLLLLHKTIKLFTLMLLAWILYYALHRITFLFSHQ